MRCTFGIINRLEKTADNIVALNPEVVKKIPNSGIHNPPYLISKVPISKLRIPSGWKVSENRIVNISTLIYLEVKNDMS